MLMLKEGWGITQYLEDVRTRQLEFGLCNVCSVVCILTTSRYLEVAGTS